MISHAQLEANRRNATLSTGPKTPEGKAASAVNSTTHGLSTTRISPRDPNSAERLQSLTQSFTQDHRPFDSTDRELIDMMASSRLRMEMIERRQLQLEDTGGLFTKDYEVLARYHRDAERGFYRALRALEDRKRQRRAMAKDLAEAVEDRIADELGQAPGKSMFDRPRLNPWAGIQKQFARSIEQTTRAVPVEKKETGQG
jgi:hypothetical protein